MPAAPINHLAVVVAAVAGFLVGWGWYAVFGKVWMQGLGKTKDQAMPLVPLVIAGIACLVMAWMLAGLMGHLGDISIRRGAISGAFVWVGFVLTTTATNQAFHGDKPVVTAIDAGHWLAVLVVMGAIIGAFGA